MLQQKLITTIIDFLNKGTNYLLRAVNQFSVPAYLFWSHQKQQMGKVGPIKRSRLDRFLYKPFHLLSGLCT